MNNGSKAGNKQSERQNDVLTFATLSELPPPIAELLHNNPDVVAEAWVTTADLPILTTNKDKLEMDRGTWLIARIESPKIDTEEEIRPVRIR